MTTVLPSETFPHHITQSLMSVSKFDMKSEWPVGVNRVLSSSTFFLSSSAFVRHASKYMLEICNTRINQWKPSCL
jgi:hypothetical protein